MFQGRHWIASVGALAFVSVLALAASAQTAPTAPAYHFKPASGHAPMLVGNEVLTPEERHFLQKLPVVRVGMALPPFQPYEVVAPDGEVSGIHVGMIRQLALAFGFQVRPVVYPRFADVLDAAKRREVDLLMSVGVTAARAEYLEFTLGATPMVSALFSRAPGGRPTPEPEAARFAIERTNIANDFVRRRWPQAVIVGVDFREQALRKIAGGEADYYVGNLLPALDELTRQPVAGIQVEQLVDYGSGYFHFAVRKDWAMLAQILNKGIGAQRHQNPEALDRALSSLPTPLLPRPRKKLTAQQWSLLLERPVWRVAAVRGLVSLNEADSAGRHQGIAAEYTEWVARYLGVGVQLMPFDNVGAMLDAARRGEVDVIPFLTRTEQRATQFAFSRPYVELPYVIVGRRDAPLYWDLGSLAGKRLAMAAQHPLRDMLARLHPKISIVDAESGQSAMDAVARGAAEAAVEVKLFANLRINADGGDSLRVLGEVRELPAQFHFATSLQAQALLPLIDEALADVPEAERTRMLRRWIAVDLQPAFNWRRYAPVIGVSAGALLLLMGSGLWWMQRLRREVRQRRESEAQLEAIGAALPCVAFRTVFDGAGHIRRSYTSTGSHQVLGIDFDPALGVLETLAPRLRREDVESATAVRQAVIERGETGRITALYQHPDGRERWLHCEVVGKRLVGKEEGWTAMTGYIADVTAELELQTKLAREAESRHLLLASASHELRAPTHTLSLALQAIANGAGDPVAHLGVAREATRTLSELITDVLDAARLDQGQLQLRPQDLSLRLLLEKIAAAARAWAQEKGLGFEMWIDPALPDRVRFDPLRVQQVLTNLLSNAVKYTASGQVRLEAERLHEAGGSPWLRLVVQDSGMGIDAERLQHMFTPYAAATGQQPVPQGSSGLGLSICKRLAELMGGRIEITSQNGRGTRVEVRVPLVEAAPLPEVTPTPAARRASDGGATPPRVLVCDDDPISRMLLAMMLEASGYAVESVGNAAAALERWRAGGVAAVVTDQDMPGMPGSELVTHIRAAEAAQDTPATRLVVCSGNAAIDMPADAGAGADAHLVKPVEVATLVATLRSLGLEPVPGAAITRPLQHP